MAIPALSLQRLNRRGSTPWTVAQGTDSRNLVIALGLIASCVITGETLTSILEAGTQAVTAVIILILVRTALAQQQHRSTVPVACPS